MPAESTRYLADSRNAPYGEKTPQEILALSIKNTEKLLEMDAKIIVVACNTATTNAISELRSRYTVPFIGIEPAIKPAALNSKTHCIGILATKGTLSSALFAQTADLYSRSSQVIEVVGTGLVEAIERGNADSPETEEILTELLRPMLDSGIDHLVLGCSHYPFLIPVLKKVLPVHVRIIDSGMAVARQTRVVLQSLDLLNPGPSDDPEFFSNGDPEILRGIIPGPGERIRVSFLDF